MKWDAYRREFADYHSASTLARYRAHAGLPATLPLDAIEDRYSDLFRFDAQADLRNLLEGGDFFTDTEQLSVKALLGGLQLGYVQTQTCALDREIALYEKGTQLHWQDHIINQRNFAPTLAQVFTTKERHDLAARWAERVLNGADLRAERWRLQTQATQALGFPNTAEYWTELTGIAPAQLAREARGFLQQTEQAYRSALAAVTPHLWPDAGRDELSYAEWQHWHAQPQPHTQFPAHDMLPAYGDALRGLGWRAGRQTNLQLDTAKRAGKQTETACFPVRPPEEVYLSLTPRNGVSAYRDFFAAAGGAQHHAWTSRDLLTRHPAFVFAPDDALNRGYAALWRAFFYDALWLREYRVGLGPEQALALARSEALLILAEVRRDCALLECELAYHAAPDPRDEALAENYAGTLTEATGFRQDPAFALLEITGAFACAARLRGVLLASSLGEYLRVRYGRRWWAVKRAGDELVDWWNTGSRYHAEEIAPLVGANSLSFDLLAESLLAVLRQKP